MNLSWLKTSSTSTGGGEFMKHEPGVTSLAMENHWKQAQDMMVKSKDPESAVTVISHFNQMISFLRISRDDPSSWTACKEFWVKNRCSDNAIRWLHEFGAQRCDKDDLKLVDALHSLLELATDDGQLLGYVLQDDEEYSTEDTWEGASFLFNLLLELCINMDPRISEAARKSFVLLIHLASKYPELENSISQEARLGVTNMTISGLSACFAQLPTFHSATDDQLGPFMQQLQFVDSVVKAANHTLSTTIADCFSKNFLYAVILPSLTQDEWSRNLNSLGDQNEYVRSVHEEIAVVTSYLQIVCENISHPLLVKSLITFILRKLIPTFLHRMNHPSTMVTVSTLSLMNVLLEFYCEDLWYELILRHLMSQNHLMVAQRNHLLPEVNFQDAALRFMSLLPSSVTDVMGPDVIHHSLLQYMNSEVIRWSMIDKASHPECVQPPVVSFASLRQTSLCSLDQSTNPSPPSNRIFPNWKYRYDGTDKPVSTSVPVENFEFHVDEDEYFYDVPNNPAMSEHKHDDDLTKGSSERLSLEHKPVNHPLSLANETPEDRFTTISLQRNNGETNSIGIGMSETSFQLGYVVGASEMESLKRSEPTNDQSDGYFSMDSGLLDGIASFGPFVDCLLNHLTNFARLHPDVILLVTDLVSTLASSRILLITSLFLDHNLTLQPSFRSFLLILNRVRLELDKSMRNQQQLVHDVWEQLNREVVRLEENPSLLQPVASQASNDNSLHSPFGEYLTDNLRKSINSNSKAIVAAMKENFQSVFHRKSIPAPINENSHETPRTGGNQGFRYLPGRTTPVSTNHEVNRIMATRAVYFTHWLLELSAIATQLCWN